MIPLNLDKTGCSNISSNCVTWQGPNIPCISLCKGDSVTEVVWKLATELCILMDTFDLTNYDLKCFSSGVCQPQTFKDFITILINKVCTIQECSGCSDVCTPCPTPILSNGGNSTSSDNAVPLAPPFQYENRMGDMVTVAPVEEYAQMIGNRVALIINSVSVSQETINEHSERLNKLENAEAQTISLPTLVPVGVLPKHETSMLLVLAATEQQFMELVTATGSPNRIYTSLQNSITNLNDRKSLANPGTNMNGLTGWVPLPQTLADSITNMAVTLYDMRLSLENLLNNYIPDSCKAISLVLNATFNTNNLTIYVSGTVPVPGWKSSTINGTTFSIADDFGKVITYSIDILNILNNNTGYVISLANTILNTTGNLLVTANPSFTNTTTGSVCGSYLENHIINVANCPLVEYTPTENSIAYKFTTSIGIQTYTVKLYDSTGTIVIASAVIPSVEVTIIDSIFENLESGTLYKARVEVNVNGQISICEIVGITTL